MTNVLLHNARIWRRSGNLYDWILFSQHTGKILSCGNGAPPSDGSTQCFDMKQQWVFPGFHDSHLHIGDTGRYSNEKLNLKQPKTVEEFKNRLKELTSNVQSGEWFIGFGWDHQYMDRMPTCEDIDAVAKDFAVVLYRVCIHICVVNTYVLNLLGLTNKTESPPNGRIGKFPDGHAKAGYPDGVLCEDGGISLVLPLIPPLTSKQKKENILSGLWKCLHHGITSVHTCDDDHWNQYVELAESELLPVHCYCSPYCSKFGTNKLPSQPVETNMNLTCNFVKVFIDGALGTRTAALSEPYLKMNSNEAENYGVLQKPVEEFRQLFTNINEAGFRLEIHVIGDKAAEVALDLLDICHISPERRPIFVHCQILRPELIERMVKAGVVPTLQPSFVPTDAAWIDANLPPKLKSCMYPWKTLLQHGLICGGSSDAPVETTNPLQGIFDAIFRFAPDGKPFVESECLTFAEAVDMYTVGSAYADGVELFKGQLVGGFQADIVVLDVPLSSDGTPVNLPSNPHALKETKIKEVWVKGIKKI